MKNLFLILLCLLSALLTNAQYDKLVKQWSLEPNENLKTLVQGDAPIQYDRGIEGKGVRFLEDGNCFEIRDGVDLMQDFTLTFWFRPSNVEKRQTLFYQFRQIPGDYNIRSFIKLEIEGGGFLLKNELNQFHVREVRLLEDRWYQVTYLFDGKETKLFLQGKLIYTTSEKMSFYEKQEYSVRNRLFIGMSNTIASQFEGTVDEIMVFQKALEEESIGSIFKVYQENYEKKLIETDLGEYTVSEDFTEKKADFEKEVIAEQVSTANLDKEEFLIVSDYEVLEPLVVRTTGVTLELIGLDDSVEESSSVAVSHNDTYLDKPFGLAKEKKEIKVALKIGKENSLTFETLRLKKGQNCRVKVNVVGNGKVIETYVFNLQEKNFILPIAYFREKEERPRNEKVITVNSRDVTIQVKDNSKVDGDIVTIKQEGKVLLENYMLTGEFKSLDVKLNPDTENEFAFVPISMGKSAGENTALVLILVNGEVIYDFSLKSTNVNVPAKLIIVHENY